MKREDGIHVEGYVAPGFEQVYAALRNNLATRGDVGASVCVYQHGVPVVDLAGGTVDLEGRQPYGLHTLQPVFSTSKGIVAMAANMLVDRGVLDLGAPVAAYWPEFARNGKGQILVRWLLTHQAGLAAIDARVSYADFLAWEPVIRLLEEQTPNWEPGTAHGYHSLTYGFLVGEVVRRLTGRSIGRWIAENIADPLGVDFFIGLPRELGSRVSPTLDFPPRAAGARSTLRLEPGTLPYRAVAFVTPPVSAMTVNDPAFRAAEVPAMNGIGTAHAVARMFAALIGEVDGRRLLSASAMERARAEQVRGADLASLGAAETAIGLGFLLPTADRPLGGSGSFGTVGLGGSRGWALPEAGLAFGYVMNQLLDVNPDPRAEALARAALECAAIRTPAP
jgi:CubicO group peptidase (beta-lactamase class C family)